jgi:hypothetical protein
MSIKDVIDRLEQAERAIVGAEFLAPVIGAGTVQLRIAGVVCQLRMAADPGWAILRARSTREADFVRAATLREVADYLALFPRVRLVLAQQHGAVWLAFPAQRGDSRFRVTGPVEAWLATDGLERFETIEAAFDGRWFWYVQRDRRSDPACAAYLREQLAQRPAGDLPPDVSQLHKRGLSREERETYAWVREQLARAQRDEVEARLSEALAHAEGRLQSYVERDEAYVVRYEVDGVEHLSVVRRDDLAVMTAGICLAGQDQRFDLTSLVGVLREAEQDGRLVWVRDT